MSRFAFVERNSHHDALLAADRIKDVQTDVDFGFDTPTK